MSDVLLQLDQESDEDFDGYVEPSDVDYEGDSASCSDSERESE